MRTTSRPCLRATVLLVAIAAGCASLPRDRSARSTDSVQETRPNVVLILADDMGYGDLSVQGNKLVSTPNIDSIAANGVRFTNGYVAAPVCSPSRAALLSGRYPQRFGHEFNPGGPPRADDPVVERLGLPRSQIILPERMKEAGYATGLIGKWHLGYAPQFMPLARGFDEYFGFLSGAHNYILGGGAAAEQEEPTQNAVSDPAAGGGLRTPVYRGSVQIEEPEYLTDAFARESVDFIERHRNKPFFLFAAFNAVHLPLQASPEYLERVSGIDNRRKRIYAAMTIALDDAVGRILTKLKDANLNERTLVIFLSDNGGVYRPDQPLFANNGPLNAGKLFVHEGGTRIPLMMQWPGRIETGSLYSEPVSAMDVVPTILDATGQHVPRKELDGVSLLPYIGGKKKSAPHDFLAWRLGRNRALREGDWKFLQYGDHPPKLYNLADDVGETKDLSAERPDKLQELLKLYSRWESGMIEPNYRVREPIPLEFEGQQIELDF